jgi:murein DD-endopeptidase MepM/ murein hydrolase activator NlpD
MVKFASSVAAVITAALPLLAIAAPQALDRDAEASLARLADEAMRHAETLRRIESEAELRRGDRDAVDRAVDEAETVLFELVARETAERAEADAAQMEFELALVALTRAEIAPSAESWRAGGLAAVAGREAARRTDAASAQADALERERRERAAGRAKLALEQARLDSAAAELNAIERDVSEELRAIENAARNLAAGRRLRPVIGVVEQRFGARAKDGRAHGISWRTRAEAPVIAPTSGVIAFAGPFRDYGQVLIIDVGDDYAVVLTGLGALAVPVGTKVAAGQPLGKMAADAIPAPALYMEVRRGDRPVDPTTWLTRQG